VDDLPDCAIGTVDADHNWGNYVVLYDERGFYVEISHFAQASIGVKPGDRIERGALIGRCGNSGYSPQPHIHIQVQLVPEVGAATVPFSFANLQVDNVFQTEATPAENARLEAVAADQALSQSLTFPLDTQLHFRVVRKEKPIGNLMITNRMAIDGSFYFDSGQAKLFYSRDQDGFMCHRLEGRDPALALLLIALPKLPLVRQTGQCWGDYLPISTVVPGWRRMVYQFGSSFWPHLASARYVGQWQSDSTLMGTITIPGLTKTLPTAVIFDSAQQLLKVSVGDRALVRQ
jgi:Peptidase family M23